MPARVSWDTALEEVARAVAARRAGGVVIVGITGPVGSGKSTLAARLTGCVVATDNYLPDYEAVPYEERDLPRHADFSRLAEDLRCLREGRAAQVPVWSFQTHRREGYREVLPAPLVACEGIHALHGAVVPHLDLKIFVEAPRAVRWSRWEMLEASGQRGWGVEKAREFFEQVAEPTFAAAERGYRECADLVVVNG